MSQEHDAAAGIRAACEAVTATAEGDEARARRILSDTSHAEAVWAAAYLLGALKESVSLQVDHDPRRLEHALKTAVQGADEDIVMTQVGLIVHEAMGGGLHG